MSSVEPIRLTHPPAPSGDVHLLPCSVLVEKEGGVMGGEGGEVRVDSYFAPLIREENEVTAGDRIVFSSAFRGRPLKGVRVDVPQGYAGVVLQECGQQGSVSTTGTTEGRELKVKGHFSHLHYWNLQMSPTADDKLLQALTWVQLSHSLHDPTPLHHHTTNSDHNK